MNKNKEEEINIYTKKILEDVKNYKMTVKKWDDETINNFLHRIIISGDLNIENIMKIAEDMKNEEAELDFTPTFPSEVLEKKEK